MDGVGGSIKRLVYMAILSGQQCKSAADFVRIGQSKTTAIQLVEMEQHQIDHSRMQLENIFQSVKSVPETKKTHSVKTLSNNSIELKYYSNSKNAKKYRFSI